MKWIGVGFLLTSATFGGACCITYARAAMHLAEETALIVWDEEAKVEHFVRKANFTGAAADFGFILPVPTQPLAIEVADEKVFGQLESMMPPPFFGIGCGKAGRPNDSKAGGVDVLEQKTVGDYEVTVLQATDGASLNTWLRKRGHKMRQAMTPWFTHYTEKKWVFVAFKYKGGAEVDTKAVRVSFKADQPHYPYKMPTDTWEKGHFRPLDLFVLSQQRMAGNYTKGGSWQASQEWSTDVVGLGAVEGYLNTAKDSIDIPDRMVLTRFKNTAAANNYDYDLTFTPDSDKTLMYAGGAVFAVVAIGYMRRRARRMASHASHASRIRDE